MIQTDGRNATGKVIWTAIEIEPEDSRSGEALKRSRKGAEDKVGGLDHELS